MQATTGANGVSLNATNAADISNVDVSSNRILLSTTDGTTTASVETTATTASVLVDNPTATHGLRVGTTSTTLSGGTTSTALLLDDTGVTFGVDDGAGNPTTPVQVHGVAAGTAATDAVNVGQLNVSVAQTQAIIHRVKSRAFSGIAAVTALAMIPEAKVTMGKVT